MQDAVATRSIYTSDLVSRGGYYRSHTTFPEHRLVSHSLDAMQASAV